ncbi:MAG TPA: SdrD B-like domain-containing protein, partial [Tepidisphaeraceae bacterium]|nr:SdrD B-like domain-containing protein [Tepidisphaeraceae bacterium]
YIRNLNKYPIAGEIQIDTADINATLANNTLGAIIEHEIAHALGFGTTWDSIGGLTNGSTTDPQFVGTNALNQYRVLSGNPTAVGIPLENTGNSGTFGTHWRESTFNTELMTGYIDPVGNELSALTIGAFQDMGYVVDYGAADAYYIPGSLGSIAGKVWNDTDGSGTQNGSEVGQQSTTVYIDADNDGTYDAGEKNTQTTSTGTYNFTNLTPGTHRVRVLLSSGFTQTFPSSNAAQVITLGFADNRTNVNFGVRQQSTATASIRGNAWKDNDQDGVIDSGESSIHARVIYIDADNDGTLDTGEQQTQTDANGDYSLAGLAAGTYRVRQVLPSGWSQTFPSANAAQVVTLTNGQQSTGKNFGSFQGTVTLASIGGTVWKDTDHDGAIDSGETVIQSRVVYLDTDNDGTLDSGESQTTSNSSGNYSFSGLAAGTYRVRQVVPSGWTQSYPASNGAQVVTLTSGQNVTGKNFGSYQVVTTGGSIRGTVWKDVNNNAVIDSGETGLSGRTVFIDADNDKILDAGEATTLTDSAGAYAFTNLPAAIYYIRQILPSGWAQTYPSNNYPHKITLNTGVNITQRNFGTNSTQPTGTASIKGTVWTDTDHDGVWDSGETGISGRTVFLDADNDKVLDSGETTTTTNSSGLYTFSQLVSGTYYVRQVLPSGWTQSFPTSNASHQIVLTTGAAITGKNFGAYTSQTTGTGSIKGTVWNDLDHDAVWDSNEVGIANRTVYIDADNDKVFDNGEKTAITNSAGLYTFSQLAAGIYYIRQVLPSGWAQSYPSTNYSQKITLNTGVNISQRNFGTFSTTAIT